MYVLSWRFSFFMQNGSSTFIGGACNCVHHVTVIQCVTAPLAFFRVALSSGLLCRQPHGENHNLGLQLSEPIVREIWLAPVEPSSPHSLSVWVSALSAMQGRRETGGKSWSVALWKNKFHLMCCLDILWHLYTPKHYGLCCAAVLMLRLVFICPLIAI
jgi:hypothetical protein